MLIIFDPGGTPCTLQMQLNLDKLTSSGYQIAFTSDRIVLPKFPNDFVMGANGTNVRFLMSRFPGSPAPSPVPLGSSQPSPDCQLIAFNVPPNHQKPRPTLLHSIGTKF